MVVKVRLNFLPTRCEAIRFIKIIQSEGDQQIGRHNVPLLTSVQRHLEKDGSPIFFGLMARHGRLRDIVAQPYKASARSVFQPTLGCSAHGCLVPFARLGNRIGGGPPRADCDDED
jgi:hypothetical protein